MQIARLFGIPIKLHWSFLLLLGVALLLMIGNVAAQMQVLVLLALLVPSVVAHELGHALAARRFDIATEDIVLTPIGGLARMRELPRNPADEIKLSLAGPMVNFAIALLLAPAVILTFESPGQAPLFSASNLLFMGLVINLLLGGFNLLPAFPMDGGQALRAFLTPKHGRLDATRKAVGLGKYFALAFAILGVFTDPTLIIVAVFIWFVGQQELRRVELEDYYRRLQAGQATVPPGLVNLLRMFGVKPADLVRAARQAGTGAPGPQQPPWPHGHAPWNSPPPGPPPGSASAAGTSSSPIEVRVVRATPNAPTGADPSPDDARSDGAGNRPPEGHQIGPDGKHYYKGQEIL